MPSNLHFLSIILLGEIVIHKSLFQWIGSPLIMRVPIVILYRRGNRFACPLHSAALYISNSNYVSRVPLNLKACVSF